jgi:hypothetical protein
MYVQFVGIIHQGLNRLNAFCRRFCRANAYINSNTDDGENNVLVSSFETDPIGLLSSNVGTVGKIFSSVCGKSLKKEN